MKHFLHLIISRLLSISTLNILVYDNVAATNIDRCFVLLYFPHIIAAL